MQKGRQFFLRPFLSGTGSYPPLQSGLQRKIRHIDKTSPTIIPHSSTASMQYSEQVGKNRQQLAFFRPDKCPR